MNPPTVLPGHVLHLIPTLFDSNGALIGGAERYALELARNMAEEVPTRLVSFGHRDEERMVGRLEVRIISGAWHVRGQAGNPLHPALFREVARAGVIHCHQTHVLMSSLTALVGRGVRRKVFTTELGGGGWDISAFVPTDAWFAGHLHISEYSRHIYGHDSNPRARVILGGVDADSFRPGDSPPARDFVLFVGRLLPHKGVDDLIRAMPTDLRLEVVGRPQDPGYLSELQEMASGKRVTFRFNLTDEALISAYREALCVVLPSVYKGAMGAETIVPELLGQTLLEGMACGTPAICTEVASMPEIVEAGKTGLVVAPNDPGGLSRAILTLRSDPGRVASMGAASRTRVLERFSWKAVVSRCLEAYRA